jgi:hypothetical protein
VAFYPARFYSWCLVLFHLIRREKERKRTLDNYLVPRRLFKTSTFELTY